VRLWAFFANLLPDVPLFQKFNELAAEEERDQQGRDRRLSSAERDVLKDVERLYEIPILVLEMAVNEFVKEVVDHLDNSCRQDLQD